MTAEIEITDTQSQPAPSRKRGGWLRSPSVWMTTVFVGMMGTIGLRGYQNLSLFDQISYWKDENSSATDPKTIFDQYNKKKTEEVVFFVIPQNATNTTTKVSQGAYYYTQDGLIHFGAVRGDAKITNDWSEFQKFKDEIQAKRATGQSHSTAPGMMYMQPSLSGRIDAPSFAAYDLQYWCLGRQVNGYQAAAFIADHLNRLGEFADAAGKKELIAYVVPVSGINDTKPFDAAKGKLVTGAEAELLLTKEMRIAQQLLNASMERPGNSLLSSETVASFPEEHRNYWMRLFMHAEASQKSIALPGTNFAMSRKFLEYKPMMVMQSDGDVLKISELGFENQVMGSDGVTPLYVEPYVKTYTRDKPITAEERERGIQLEAKPLTEIGWTQHDFLHGGDAVQFIAAKQAELTARALDITTEPPIKERAIQVYCQTPSQAEEPGGQKPFYYWGSDINARFVMIDVRRDVMIFDMQVRNLYTPELKKMLVDQQNKPAESTTSKVSSVSSTSPDPTVVGQLIEQNRQNVR